MSIFNRGQEAGRTNKLESRTMMQVEEYKSMLEKLGWQVEVRQGQQSSRVPVAKNGLLECGDGRLRGQVVGAGHRILEKAEVPEGPKLFGGVLYLMKEIGGDEKALIEAIKRVQAYGWIPTVHGDDHGPHHCGMRALWAKGDLAGVGVKKELQLTPEQIMQIVTDNGGLYVGLRDQHVEEALDINFIPDSTRKADDRRFHVDLWAAEKLGIDNDQTVFFSQAAVRALAPQVNTVYLWT